MSAMESENLSSPLLAGQPMAAPADIQHAEDGHLPGDSGLCLVVSSHIVLLFAILHAIMLDR